MEFVFVKYTRQRDVYMDGTLNGETNETLRVETGTHVFDLGKDKDYTPESVKAKVENTSQIRPMVVAFTPIEEAP